MAVDLLICVATVACGCSLLSSPETTTAITPETTTTTTVPTLTAGEEEAAMAAVQSLLDAWAAGDFPAVRAASPDADHDLLGLHVAWTDGLSLRGATYEATRADLQNGLVTVTYVATLDLGTAGTWTYEGSLPAEADDALLDDALRQARKNG